MNLPIVEHPEIPVGIYCYTASMDSNGVRRIKSCTHWKKTDEGARCELLDLNTTELCPYHLVWDQVKECRINMDEDFDPVSREDWIAEAERKGYLKEEITCDCGKQLTTYRVVHKKKEPS